MLHRPATNFQPYIGKEINTMITRFLLVLFLMAPIIASAQPTPPSIANSLAPGTTNLTGVALHANGLLFNSGSILTNMVSANSGVLVTSAGGVPSISTTLPAVNGAAVTNVSAATLNGATFASPGAIGGGTPGSGAFTSLASSGNAIINTVSVGKGISTGGASDNGKDTVLGYQALSTANTGYLNTAIGYQSLKSLTGVTGGYTNVAVGALSMYSTTIGLENTAAGYRVLYNNLDGYQNTVVGSNAMWTNTGGYNNTAVGMYSLFSNVGSIAAPNGYANSAFGFSALYSNTTGERNTGIGYNAAFSNSTGSYNTVVGMNSLYNLTGANYNTVIGYNTGSGILTGGSNTIVGSQVSGLSGTLADTVIIANGNGAVRFYSDSAGLTGVGTSAPAAKFQVTGGDAYISSGAVGIGNNTLTAYTLRLGKNITGATTAHGIFSSGSIQSDVTGAVYMVRTQPLLAASAFNLSFLYHFAATQGTFGAGSSNSVQHGFFADTSLIGATTNYSHYADNTAAITAGKTSYGFFSNVNVQTGGGTTWGFYGGGTAANRFNSDLTVYGGTAIPAGGTAGSGYKLSSTSNFGVFFGSGAPSLSAARGSLYLRSDGLPYYNTNGTTGWDQLGGLAAANTWTAAQTFTGTITTGGYTVAGLPAAPGTGARAYVTNQLTTCAVTGAALTGGGAVTCPVFYNGTAWVGG